MWSFIHHCFLVQQAFTSFYLAKRIPTKLLNTSPPGTSNAIIIGIFHLYEGRVCVSILQILNINLVAIMLVSVPTKELSRSYAAKVGQKGNWKTSVD